MSERRHKPGGLVRLGEALGGDSLKDDSPGPESPIEDRFERGLRPFLHPRSDLRRQVEIFTRSGRFRVDYFVECNGRRVVFECDGRDFHDGERDDVRDALILETPCADVIYRLPGVGITYYLLDCIALLSRMEPSLFRDTARSELEIDMSSACRNDDSCLIGSFGALVDFLQHPEDENGSSDSYSRARYYSLFISRDDGTDARLKKIRALVAMDSLSPKVELLRLLKSQCPEEY